MNKSIQKTLLLMILMVASIVFSQEVDEIRYENILKQLKIDTSKVKEDLVIEKEMPNAKGSYIVVIPVLVGEYQYDSFSVKNTILITDKKGTIKSKYTDNEEYDSDAIMLQNFSIDTGLYILNPGNRAFGIVAHYRNGSQPNPYSTNSITLYLPQEKTLKNILNSYEIYRFSGEWDTNCAGQFNEENSVIILGKTKTNNFVDLKLKTENIKTFAKKIDGECVDDITSTFSYKTLKMSKKMYK